MFEKHGITPIIIEYLKTPPTVEKITEILVQLEFTPRELMRKKGAVYAEFKFDNLSLSDDNLIGFRVEHPILQESGMSGEERLKRRLWG